MLVAARALRERRRAALDVALLFGVMALLLFLARTAALLAIPAGTRQAIVTPLILAVPYLMLRLVADFATVPWWALGLAEAAFAGEVAALLLRGSLPLAAVAAYVAIAIAWSSVAFVREARRSRGVTGRRYMAIATGNAAVVASLMVVVLTVPSGQVDAPPGAAAVLQLCVFAVGVAYFAGFATPAWLRQLWRDADLRSFLARTPSLLAVPDSNELIRELAVRARDAMGFEGALIGRPTGAGLLRFGGTEEGYEAPADQTFSGRAMRAGRALVSLAPVRDVPARAALYRERNVKVLVAAPMRTGDQTIGVLVARSSHASTCPSSTEPASRRSSRTAVSTPRSRS